jgi:hypothetical protein
MLQLVDAEAKTARHHSQKPGEDAGAWPIDVCRQPWTASSIVWTPSRPHCAGSKEDAVTDDLEDSAQWRDGIASRLGTLKTKVETEAHLRAAMDKDMGTLSAKFGVQEKLIQAISLTQSDHTKRLTRLEVGQEELQTKLDRVHVGVEAIHTLLTGLTLVDADPEALP